MTTQQIERLFMKLLLKRAKEWEFRIEQVTKHIDKGEIDNREVIYSKIHLTVTNKQINIALLKEAINKCWACGHRIEQTRINRFFEKKEDALQSLTILVKDFPQDDTGAAERIDQFLNRAVELGFNNPKGGSDKSGAAVLASIILTSVFPDRFVDFRFERWKKFAKYFKFNMPLHHATYGSLLIWAGQCAIELKKTSVLNVYWPKRTPLWAISGICWEFFSGQSPQKPKVAPSVNNKIHYQDFEPEYEEGNPTFRKHLKHERNRKLIQDAKLNGILRDPMLRCEACGFSFVERFGDIGRDYIEAHHLIPVASMKAKSKIKLQDIALVCANCHRMFHRSETWLSIKDMKQLLAST
jgi:hypothetical protein